MRYSGLFAVTDLLNDIRQGKEIKPHRDTKIELASVENYFKNLIADIDKRKIKSNAEVMTYQLRIEVKR